MVYLPHRNHINSIWKWSEFHLNSKKKNHPEVLHGGICVQNLVQIGRHLDIEMITQQKRSQNHRMTETQTYKLFVISLLGKSEKHRIKVSAQLKKIT